MAPSKRKYLGNGVWADVEEETKEEATELDVALKDVATRFLTHLPPSELESADRLFFQLEQAHWFYEDFLADAPGAKLPHFHLRLFTQHLFARCALLKPLVGAYEELFLNFREYKGKIPVCGCVLLDPSLTKLLLVRNWAKTSWGLPKGKLNQNESKKACAAREVLEETGFDPGLDNIEEENAIEIINNNQHSTMYVVAGVPTDYPFEPKVRKEISKVAFFPLDDLPKEQWNVDKFIPRIHRWVKANRKKYPPKGKKRADFPFMRTAASKECPLTAPAVLAAPPKQPRDLSPPPVVVKKSKPRPPLLIPDPVDYGNVSFGPDFVLDVDAIVHAVDGALESDAILSAVDAALKKNNNNGKPQQQQQRGRRQSRVSFAVPPATP